MHPYGNIDSNLRVYGQRFGPSDIISSSSPHAETLTSCRREETDEASTESGSGLPVLIGDELADCNVNYCMTK